LAFSVGAVLARRPVFPCIWVEQHRTRHFLRQLSDRGYDWDRLNDIPGLVDAPDSDLFDVLSYILFTNPPKTRQERADKARPAGVANAEGDLKDLLLAILRAYEARGESDLATKKLGTLLAARFGSVNESRTKLGGLAARIIWAMLTKNESYKPMVA